MPDELKTQTLESKVAAALEAVSEETFNVSFNSAKFAKVLTILGTNETAEQLINAAVEKEIGQRLSSKRDDDVEAFNEARRVQYAELTK